MPRGGIVGVVELWDVVKKSPSWWFTGPVGWRMRNPREFETMIVRRGFQGLINCDPETERKILAKLASL